MSFVPSADLLKDIAFCPTCVQQEGRTSRDGLCHRHRARWNLELCMAKSPDSMGEAYLDTLMRSVLASDHGSAQLLSALERQLRALQAVWAAHESGAVHLPDSVAASVAQARFEIPDFLPGSTHPVIQQAS